MNVSRKTLKMNAQDKINSNFGSAILTYLLITVIQWLVSFGITVFQNAKIGLYALEAEANLEGLMINFAIVMVVIFSVSIFITNPLRVLLMKFHLQNPDGKISDIDPSRINYMNVVLTCFMRDLFIGLWSLLFFFPGIWKTYQYMYVDMILADDSDIYWRDALDKSKKMTDGIKFELIILGLSFFLWYFVAWIPVINFWVSAYINQTFVESYLSQKNATV